MKCQDVENILVEGGERSAEVREHLASCHSCRSFARLLDGATAPRPSAELDKAVLTQVKAEMRMRNRRRPAWLHIAYAAAASILLVLSLWVGHQAFWGGGEETAGVNGTLVAETDADELSMPLDPLVGMWMAADDAIDDVEFTMDCSDLVADVDTRDADTDSIDGKSFSSEEFSNLADGMFSLELMMYQANLN